MEKIYRKKGRKYVHIGYDVPDLTDGIWMVKTDSSSKSTTSLIWKIGDLPQADMKLHASLQKYEDELSRFLSGLSKTDSDAYKFYSETCVGDDNHPIEIYGTSTAELMTTILRKLATLIQEDNKK